MDECSLSFSSSSTSPKDSVVINIESEKDGVPGWKIFSSFRNKFGEQKNVIQRFNF